jgi:DNA-binding MarR family transcriptional regulator
VNVHPATTSTDDPVQLWRDTTIWIEDVAARIERDLASGSGLSGAEYQVIATLASAQDGAMEQLELRRALHWSASRLSHLLRRMRARGLCDATELGRGTRMRVRLTAAGAAAYEAARSVYATAVREHLLDMLSPQHRAELRSAVERGLSRIASERNGFE